MVYEKVQKDSSSWNPAFQHQKSESLFRSRPFSIPAEADTDSAQEQEIPTYSRADRDAISAKLLKSMEGNVQSQAETPSQKPDYEQSPAFDHHKSESFFQPRPFSIQPQADTDSAQEQEIPAYSRAERDTISAKLFKPMGKNVQSQAETQSQNPDYEKSPAFDHHKSESFFRPRPFSIQPQADTDSAQEQEIPIYSRAERDAISAKLFKPMEGNVQTQAETPSQKPKSEQSPVFDHHKSESFFRPRPFSIQPQADTDSAQEQEIPAYSRAERDAISAKLFKPRDGNVQSQTETVSQKPDYESEGLESEKVSAEAETLQRNEESPESGDDDENSPNGGAIQRQPNSSDNEEEELSPETGAIQRQPDSSDNEDDPMKSVQTKLNIGAPGDKYEQEADSVAERVMSMNAPANPQAIQRQGESEEELIQKQPLSASITPLIQRFSEEVQTKPSVQKAGESGASQAGASLESRLSSQKGGGTPLDDEVKSFMEPRFGTDFSGVRIHTGGDAVSMNKELHAQAFAHGSDIYFNAGKYNPGSNEGKQLLAHELTHVVQQTGVKTLQQKPLTSLQSNKETLQTKISPTLGAAIQLKKAPASPQADPAFQAVVNKTKGVAKQQKAHPPAKAKSSEAQAAAKPPANEVESKAQDKKVQEMNQQQPGKFNAAAFKAALMQKIAAITPNTLEEADKFKESNKIGSVKSEVSSQVTDEKKQASGPIENKTKEEPNTSGIKPKPVTPLPPKQAGSKPGDVGATGATPKPKDASEVSLQEGSKSLDEEMASAKVTEEQLKKSNEPEFQGAVAAKKTAQTDAAKAPQEYRQQEQGIVTQAQAQAKTTAATELQGMHGSKEQVLAKVLGNQSEAKGQDEQKRTEVANHIQGIYNNTKQKVETSLSQLDGEVNKDFDAGAATAQKLFEDYVGQRMKRYKDERYSGLGAARWVTDKLFGMPSEVNAFYQEGKKQYLASMDKTIDKIANLVSTKLSAAKQEITKGRQEIQKYVAGLDPSLRQVGQEAAQNIQSQFDELETSVDNKQNELIDSLAQKYNDNLQQLNARLDEMKAANRGLVDKAKDAMGGVIKTILELKNMLMGVLAKSAGAIDKIILDPIAFLGNLISGIKQGFNKFAGNIDKHLKKGLLGWLTGALAGAGVTMPESFDLKGIFSLVMQVLGVVYEGIKSRCIKALGKNGEKMFTALESSFEMFVILKNEGIGGLWKFLQDKIGDLKVMVIDTIQTFVIENVIKAGVLWVVSLLNPASAFVKACKAIYDIIMFFIERGSQIAQLVNAVTDSVSEIASGAVGGAAALIENALGTSLPVVISFMASLLGLGGISEKIGGIIKTVRTPIDKAIDWLIAQAVKFAKKIGKKLGFGKDKKGKEDEVGEEGTITAADREKHEQYAQEIEQKLKEKNHKFKDFESFHTAKQNEAEKLRDQYQKKLKEGIKLSIDLKAPEADKKDGDIDVEIKIAPNTTVRDIQLGGDGNQSFQERVALMEQKYENDYKGIKKENAEFEKYKHLETELKQLKERTQVEDSPELEKDIEKAEKKFIALKNILEIRKELDKISQGISTDKVRMDAVIIYGDYNLSLKKLDGTRTEKIENKYTTISGQDEQVIKLEQHFKETKQRLLNEFEVLEIRDREVRQLEVNLDQKKDKDRPDPSHDAETKLLERIIEEIGRIVTPDNQIDQGKLQEAQKREKEIRRKFEETNNLRKQIEVNQQESQTALANSGYSSFEELQEAYTALTKTLREEKRNPNREEATIFKQYKTANGAKNQVASAQKKLEEMGGIMTVEEREQKIHEVYRDLNLEERTKLGSAIQEWEITGTININDEQAACSSCQGIIRALRSRFSNLKVNLVEVVKSYHGF